jgi:HEAT repeat protein
MKRIYLVLTLFSAASLILNATYAQPKIPQDKIPSNVASGLEKQIEKLYSENPLERQRAAIKIGEYGKEAEPAIPFLVELLADSNYCPEPGVIYNHTPLVYETVNWAIIQTGTASVKPLIDALSSSSPLARRNAVYCLGKIKDIRAVPPLINLLNDKDSTVKWQVIRAFSELKDKRATGPLLNLLNDEHSRADIVYVLGQIGDASAIDTLSFYLKDKNIEVRIAVAAALGNIGHKSAVFYLVDALSDSDSRVKTAAVLSLGEIGDPSAVDALVPFVNSGEKELGVRAIDALMEIGDATAVEALILFLDNKNPDIRKNASWALHSIRGAGISYGEDATKWEKWLNENRARLENKNR